MLKVSSTTATQAQLLAAFVASFHLFLVAFSFVALAALLFVRATLLFAGAWLSLLNAGCNALIDLLTLYDGTRDMAAFLAAR